MTATRTSGRRIAFAFLGAPLIVPFVICLPLPGESLGTTHFSWSSFLGPLIVAPYALFASFIAESLLGVPALMIFRRYGVRSLSAFAAAGALMGWLVNLMMEAPTGNLATKPLATLFNPLDNPYISVCVVAGASSAVLFRTIMFWGSKESEDPK